MDEGAAPRALVVDGSNLAASTPGKTSLARLESATAALRAAVPLTECVVLVDADLGSQLSDAEAARLDELVASGVVTQLPRDAPGGIARAVLTQAQERNAAVVSNDTFYKERERFPWLADVDRLIGHSYGGDGWWVFMTRNPSARSSWTGHDAAPAIQARPDVRRSEQPARPAASTVRDARTYDDLVASAAPAIAVVGYAVVQQAVAIVFEEAGARAREELVARIVTADLGLTMYGSAALLYRFEGAGIVTEVGPGELEPSSGLSARAAADLVSADILGDLLDLGDSALGHRDEAAARRALGVPDALDVGASPPASPGKSAPPSGPTRPEPTAATTPAAKARPTATKPATPAKPKAAPAKQGARTPAVAKATTKRAAADKSGKGSAEKAAKRPAASTARPASPAPATGARAVKPRVRSGPNGTEWVVRCPDCGAELVASDRAAAAAKLSRHRCRG
jgi:hypothetical protein